MSKLWFLPLEPLDKRYTIQTRKLFVEEFQRRGLELEVIDGEVFTAEIEGELKNVGFLDAFGTTYYKAEQLKKLAGKFRTGEIADGDVIFVEDEEYPLEWIQYMNRMGRRKIRLYAFCHAGTWIKSDEINLRMGDVIKDVEKGWMQMLDGVFVGSEYHKRVILGAIPRLRKLKNVFVTGLPFSGQDLLNEVHLRPWLDKEDNVVFTGRLHPEKQPELFDKLQKIIQREFPQVTFIRTLDQNLSKRDYYELLNRSKIMVSFALQENFGFSFRESLTFNCVSVVPNRLAYKEYVPKELRYSTFSECVDKVRYYLKLGNLDTDYSRLFHTEGAVCKMIKVIYGG